MSKLSASIGDAAEREFGFRPVLLLMTGAELSEAVARNPFPDAAKRPRTLHFFFLGARPESPDIDGIREIAADDERYDLNETVYYLHAPSGFGTSKLAKTAERKLGVSATARNYTTVSKLVSMVDKP